MTSTHATHRMIATAGMAAVVAGVILAIGGLAIAPAGAAPGGSPSSGGEISICHRTNAPSNPYRVVTVSFDGADGSLQGPDHTGHAGPVFDFSADPSDPAYPYTTPRDGDQWGDIIPAYSWDGGSYPGMNWPDGQAIWQNGCNGPEEGACPDGSPLPDEGACPTSEECPDGSEPVQGECPGEECPDGSEPVQGECEDAADVCPDLDGVQTDPADCPAPTDACPDVDGVQTDAADCAPELIPDIVVTRVEPTTTTVPVQVLGAQVLPAAAELPRTGTGTLPMAELGLGLVLLGAGALVFSREDTATA